MYQLSQGNLRSRAGTSSRMFRARRAPQTNEPVIRSCETLRRAAAGTGHYFAKPTTDDVQRHQVFVPMSAQLRVYKIVDRYMNVSARLLRDQSATRAGRLQKHHPSWHAVRADSVPHNGYCPSHQHMAEKENVPTRRLISAQGYGSRGSWLDVRRTFTYASSRSRTAWCGEGATTPERTVGRRARRGACRAGEGGGMPVNVREFAHRDHGRDERAVEGRGAAPCWWRHGLRGLVELGRQNRAISPPVP